MARILLQNPARRRRQSSHIPFEFDAIESNAESLADSMLRESPSFKTMKRKLKLAARQAAEKMLRGMKL